MTGYTVHTGTSDEFVDGWDRVFSGSDSKGSKKPRKKAATAKSKAAPKAKAAPKKKKKASSKSKSKKKS